MSKHFPTEHGVKIFLRANPNYEESSSSCSKNFGTLNRRVEGARIGL
ncbi:MAG: hypothetical protein HA494_03470 [Thaumarchaeota archaeon]|nr:hypothetical protein [Nitrososphaerota archaeon]